MYIYLVCYNYELSIDIKNPINKTFTLLIILFIYKHITSGAINIYFIYINI